MSIDRRRFVVLAAALVALRVALPLVALDPAWEFHRDELLYFAMGDHVEWWRMQFPPLLPAIAAVAKGVFDTSVWAARVPAALAGGGVLAVMLATVRLLGGGAGAAALAALASVAAPVLLRTSTLMQPVVLDVLWGTLALLAIAAAIVRDAPRWWLLAGVAFGLGTLTKLSAPLYGLVAFVAARLHPVTRHQLATRWPWLAAALSLVIGAPSFTGQVAHGWPFVAQLAALRAGQLAHVSVGDFLVGQPMMLGAAAVPAAIGLAWACRGARPDGDAIATRRAAAVRWLALCAALLVAWYLVMRGKEYYTAVAWPPLVAAGSVAIARVRGSRLARFGARVALPAAMLAATAVLFPLGVPCLAPAAMAAYVTRLGVGGRTNTGGQLDLPQDYADMLGWRAQAEAVARAWRALPAAERGRATITATNYGRAGAVAMYARELGLPYPVSPVGDFWAWGPGAHDGDVTLLVGDDANLGQVRSLWTDVATMETLRDPRRVDEERTVIVLRVRGIRRPLRLLWPMLGPRWG